MPVDTVPTIAGDIPEHMASNRLVNGARLHPHSLRSSQLSAKEKDASHIAVACDDSVISTPVSSSVMDATAAPISHSEQKLLSDVMVSPGEDGCAQEAPNPSSLSRLQHGQSLHHAAPLSLQAPSTDNFNEADIGNIVCVPPMAGNVSMDMSHAVSPLNVSNLTAGESSLESVDPSSVVSSMIPHVTSLDCQAVQQGPCGSVPELSLSALSSQQARQPLHPLHTLAPPSAMHSAGGNGMLPPPHPQSSASADARNSNGNVSEFELARRLGVRFDSSNAAWVARWVDPQSDRKKSRWFSIAKYGNAAARRLAIQACLHNMKPSDFLNLRDLQDVLKTFNTAPPTGPPLLSGLGYSQLPESMLLGGPHNAGFPGLLRGVNFVDPQTMQAMGLFGSAATKLGAVQFAHPHLLQHPQHSVAAAGPSFGVPGFTNPAMAGYMAAAAAAAAAMPQNVAMTGYPNAAAAALASVFCPSMAAQQQQLHNLANAAHLQQQQQQQQHHHQQQQQQAQGMASSLGTGIMGPSEQGTPRLLSNDNNSELSHGVCLMKQEETGALLEATHGGLYPSAPDAAAWGRVAAAPVAVESRPDDSIEDSQNKVAVYEQVGNKAPTDPATLDDVTPKHEPSEKVHGSRLSESDTPTTIQEGLPSSSAMVLENPHSPSAFLKTLNPQPSGGCSPEDTSASRFMLSGGSSSSDNDTSSVSSSSSTPSDASDALSLSSVTSDDEDGSNIKHKNRAKRRKLGEPKQSCPSGASGNDGASDARGFVEPSGASGQEESLPSGASQMSYGLPRSSLPSETSPNGVVSTANSAHHSSVQSSPYFLYPPFQLQQHHGSGLLPQDPSSQQPSSLFMHPQSSTSSPTFNGTALPSLPFLPQSFGLALLHPHSAAAAAASHFFSPPHNLEMYPSFVGGYPHSFVKCLNNVTEHNSSSESASQSTATPGYAQAGVSLEGSALQSSGGQDNGGGPFDVFSHHKLLGDSASGGGTGIVSYDKRGSSAGLHHHALATSGNAKMTCERGLHYSKCYLGSQECWIAVWNTKGGRIMHEAFDVAVLGFDSAKNKAREARDAAHSNNMAVTEHARPSWKSHSNTGIPHVSLDSQQLRFRAHKFGRRLCRSFSFGRRRGSYASRESAFDAAVLWLIQTPTEEEIAAVSGMTSKIEEAM